MPYEPNNQLAAKSYSKLIRDPAFLACHASRRNAKSTGSAYTVINPAPERTIEKLALVKPSFGDVCKTVNDVIFTALVTIWSQGNKKGLILHQPKQA